MASVFVTQITTWNTKKSGKRLDVSYQDYYLLNSNRIIELRAIDDDSSKFYYANDPDDARDSPDYIECNSNTTTIEAYRNLVLPSKFITLPIFPGFDITETPIDTEIEIVDIAYAWASYKDLLDAVCHLVYYRKAWERVECLVDLEDLDAIMELVNPE